MINPDVSSAVERDSVTIGFASETGVGGSAADVGVAGGFAVVDANVMDNDVGDILESDAGAVADVNVGAAAVDCFEGIY